MIIARRVLCWITSLALCTTLFPFPINGNGVAWASTPSLSQAESDYESEPNDDMDQADTIRPGVPFIGSPRPGHTDIHPGRALEGQHPPDNVLAHLLPAVRRARRALPPAQRQHRQRDDPVRGPDRHSDSVREPPSGNVLRAPLRGRNRIARRKLRGAFGVGRRRSRLRKRAQRRYGPGRHHQARRPLHRQPPTWTY